MSQSRWESPHSRGTCWAAPVVETIAAVLQMNANKLHPSINVDDLDQLKGLIESACSGLGADVKPDPIVSETMRNLYDGVPMEEVRRSLILAARALGLDCGPMSGFDAAKVDAAFWAGTTVKTNFIVNLGHGDASKLFARRPRLSFDEPCKLA